MLLATVYFSSLAFFVLEHKVNPLVHSYEMCIRDRGANITQVGLNFSRPAAQILGQYYQFIRLGFQGYKEVQYNSCLLYTSCILNQSHCNT